MTTQYRISVIVSIVVEVRFDFGQDLSPSVDVESTVSGAQNPWPTSDLVVPLSRNMARAATIVASEVSHDQP